MNSEIIIYQNPDGNIKIDVRLEEETVWLRQAQMATLFGKGRSTITEHINNVFAEGELNEEVVCRNFRLTTQHDAIEGKTQEREVKHYNLDVIISVGYRVKSQQGTQFRICATQRLREYIIKGFTLNDDRKIKDIYTTSIDYDPKDEKTLEFFKVVQNKLLWAISQQTAAELGAKSATKWRLKNQVKSLKSTA